MKGVQFDMHGGRSGDQARTLYSLWAFAEEAGVHPVWNEFYWDKIHSRFFNEEGCKKHMKAPSEFDKQIIVADTIKWNGLPYADFKEICNAIEDSDDGTLCIVKGTPRVEPWKLNMWHHDKLIKWKVETRPKVEYQKLFYYGFEIEKIDEVIIQVRRGDRSDYMRECGYTYDYYVSLIDWIKNNISMSSGAEMKITIISSDAGRAGTSNDLLKLGEIDRVRVDIGDYHDFDRQVLQMLGCSHLFINHSGFTKAIYYAKQFGNTYINESVFGGQYDKMKYYGQPENLKFYR